VPRFDVIFRRTEWFGDDVVWLAPEPDNGFRALTTAVCSAFPDYPPYGGAFTDVIPHLTLGAHADLSRMRAAARATSAQLPIKAAVPALFQAQVAATPTAVVVFEDTTLTYTQLNAKANQLAHILIARGIGPEQIVALALPRSAQLIVSILAVLKTGAGYLPVDPDYPPARIELMLSGAQPVLLLTNIQTETTCRTPVRSAGWCSTTPTPWRCWTGARTPTPPTPTALPLWRRSIRRM
jgi:non-ribosomal peptide synthetase component F